jgi:hypothetical protein
LAVDASPFIVTIDEGAVVTACKGAKAQADKINGKVVRGSCKAVSDSG